MDSIQYKVASMRHSVHNKRQHALLNWQAIQKPSRLVSAFRVYALAGLLLIQLPACQQIAKQEPFGIHRGMTDGAPEGSETFRQGWKSGCNSGIAALGTLQQKVSYGFEYDPNMLESNEYHNAWRLGFRYCRWYTTQWTR